MLKRQCTEGERDGSGSGEDAGRQGGRGAGGGQGKATKRMRTGDESGQDGEASERTHTDRSSGDTAGRKRQRTDITEVTEADGGEGGASESGEGLGEASAPLALPRSIPVECVPQEYDVEVDVDTSIGFGIYIGEKGNDIIVMRFPMKSDGTTGPAEASGVGLGHVLQAIDGVPVADKKFNEVTPFHFPSPFLPLLVQYPSGFTT